MYLLNWYFEETLNFKLKEYFRRPETARATFSLKIKFNALQKAYAFKYT